MMLSAQSYKAVSEPGVTALNSLMIVVRLSLGPYTFEGARAAG